MEWNYINNTSVKDLIERMNESGIKREEVQSIIYNPERDIYSLIYYK